MNKFFTILLICILFSNSFVICSNVTFVGAASISKPSVPEFTLQFIDDSYDVSPTVSKDPFNGDTVMTKEGYRVNNGTVKVKIKNQPFTSYKDSQGNWLCLCYNVRWKGHFDDTWREYISSRFGNEHTYIDAGGFNSVGSWSTNTPHTELTYYVGIDDNMNSHRSFSLGSVSNDGQIDFQVQALIGYYTVTEVLEFFRLYDHYEFTGESSDWSRTQTVAIGASSSGVQNQSPTDKNPDFPPTFSSNELERSIISLSLTESVLIVLAVVLIVLLGISLFCIRKKLVTNFLKENS
jgi:hypothetical protein